MPFYPRNPSECGKRNKRGKKEQANYEFNLRITKFLELSYVFIAIAHQIRAHNINFSIIYHHVQILQTYTLVFFFVLPATILRCVKMRRCEKVWRGFCGVRKRCMRWEGFVDDVVLSLMLPLMLHISHDSKYSLRCTLRWHRNVVFN